MTIPLLVVAVAVVVVFLGVMFRWSLAGASGDPAPAAGWHRCRACRGSGAKSDASTKSGFAMCIACNGTGWSQA